MMRVAQSSLPDLRGVACTGQYRGSSNEQHDGVAVLQGRQAQRCALAVLADRLGRRKSDALTAESLVLATQHCFDHFSPAEESPQSFFTVLVDQVHTVLRLAAVATARTAQSSFAAVLVQPDRVDWCHVGNTRIYHFRGPEMLHCTVDHAWADQHAPEGPAGRARAGVQDSKPRLVSAMGSQQAPMPSIDGISDPCSGDSFLLCSDGLWACFEAAELGEIIASNSCRDAAALLIELARQRSQGHPDNCSLVLIGLDHDA